MAGPVQRFGDIFPLPGFGPPESHSHALGRATRQRVSRRARIVESCNSTVWSLNALAGHVSPHLHEPSFLHVNQAQSRSHAHIHQLHSEDKVVNDLSEEASLQAMLKTGGGYSSAPGVLASYTRGAVSLPYDQCTPRRVESMLSDEVIPFMVDFKDRMVLSDAELGAVFQNTELPGCYVDPMLEHDPLQYAGFVQICIVVSLFVLMLPQCPSVDFSLCQRSPSPTVRFSCVW